MVQKVRVYNDNDHDFAQDFKGTMIIVPAKKFIEMEYYEAHEFKSKFSRIKFDADNRPLPESYKRLRIVDIDHSMEEKKDEFECQACSKKFHSAKLLDDHVTESHLELLVDEKEKEKRSKK